MKPAKPIASNVGRPAGRESDKVRADLLEAAREHFLQRDFKAVSLREIASSAGVNGAMVNYYFGGKKGLYIAMVDELFESLDLRMNELNDSLTFNIADFSRSYTLLLLENPWWPNFVVREILFNEGETKEEVLKRFSSLIAPRLMQAIKQEIANGNYRSNLKPEFTILSLMGMTIFPFMAKPIIEQVFASSIDENTASELAAHNIELFLNGVHASNQNSIASSEGGDLP